MNLRQFLDDREEMVYQLADLLGEFNTADAEYAAHLDADALTNPDATEDELAASEAEGAALFEARKHAADLLLEFFERVHGVEHDVTTRQR